MNADLKPKKVNTFGQGDASESGNYNQNCILKSCNVIS